MVVKDGRYSVIPGDSVIEVPTSTQAGNVLPPEALARLNPYL